MPSHVAALVCVVPVGQLWLRHDVDVSQKRHLLAPSHSPSRPQLVRSLAVQRPPGSAPPEGTGVHVPTWLETLQLWHRPLLADEQLVLQHTPSTQLPLSHWLAEEQDEPLPFFPHE